MGSEMCIRDSTQVAKALKRQLISAVEPIYLRALKAQHIGYGNRTLAELFNHLMTSYGIITPTELETNMMQLKEQWDPNQPFEMLIDQVERAVDYADAGGDPLSTATILNTAYNHMFKTGIYFLECKDWNAKTTPEKTWTNFKLSLIHI